MRILLIISLLIFTLFADDDDDDDKRDHHHYSKDFTSLYLTSQQKDNLKDILKEYRHDVKRYRHYKKEALEEKEDLFSEDTLDTNKLTQLNQKVSLKASNIEIDFLEKIHEILSKEQREEFTDFIEEWEIE
jgi:Spy/CpxP family protein refolding chaperone